MAELHTFQEACECLEDGGAVHRFGKVYPIYYIKQYSGPDGGLRMRFWGGSSGECDIVHTFTPEEQQSTDWQLISKEEWNKREEAMRKGYKELIESPEYQDQIKRYRKRCEWEEKPWYMKLFAVGERDVG